MTTPTASATLRAYEDKVNRQIQESKTKLEQLEAKAKEKRAQAELNAINSLKDTRENIQRKVQDLKTTHENHMARAQTAIDADLAAFKARIEELGATLETTIV
jgi:division protein CdvB (Snf7/Vps24/ESCRT-III family)